MMRQLEAAGHALASGPDPRGKQIVVPVPRGVEYAQSGGQEGRRRFVKDRDQTTVVHREIEALQ